MRIAKVVGLREAILQLDITQVQFAVKAGVSTGTIWNLVSGRPVKATLAKQVAKAAGLPVEAVRPC